MSKCRSFILSLAAVAAGFFCSCQQQNVNYPVLFLTQADNSDAGARLTVYYNGKYYNRLPALSQKHFGKFSSFLNPQDGSFGVRLFVKEEYRAKLFYTTLENRGRLILPIVGGLAYAPMMIDRPIQDGEVDILGGLNGYDLMMIGKQIEPRYPELEKKRYIKENPRPLPKFDKPRNTKDRYGRTYAELPTSRNN